MYKDKPLYKHSLQTDPMFQMATKLQDQRYEETSFYLLEPQYYLLLLSLASQIIRTQSRPAEWTNTVQVKTSSQMRNNTKQIQKANFFTTSHTIAHGKKYVMLSKETK